MALVNRQLGDPCAEVAGPLPRLAFIKAAPDAIVGAGIPDARSGFGHGQRRNARLEAASDARPRSAGSATLENRRIGMLNIRRSEKPE